MDTHIQKSHQRQFMLLTRIEKIGDSAVLFLTDEMLKLLNIGFGDEVEVSVEADHKLVVLSALWMNRNESI